MNFGIVVKHRPTTLRDYKYLMGIVIEVNCQLGKTTSAAIFPPQALISV